MNDISNGFDGSITAIETVPLYREFNRLASLFYRLVSQAFLLRAIFF